MKITDQVFLSFQNKEEYSLAVKSWKWNMQELTRHIRSIKFSISSRSRRLSTVTDPFFVVEESFMLAEFQARAIAYAKIATKMLKIRAKMKKIAGEQMKARIANEATQGNLVTA